MYNKLLTPGKKLVVDKSSTPTSNVVSKSDVKLKWTLVSNTACRDQNGNYSSLMFNQTPPYFNDTLANCKAACVSNAACHYSDAGCTSSSNVFCVGIDFFPLGLPGFGNCSLLSDTPYASTMNKDREFCYSYVPELEL